MLYQKAVVGVIVSLAVCMISPTILDSRVTWTIVFQSGKLKRASNGLQK
jgi:hypothetical protein